MILSYDIETYGKLSGHPAQTQFNPFRSFHIDGVPYPDQILCASLTLCTDPRPSSATPWTAALVSLIRPTTTLVVPLAPFQSKPRSLPPTLAHLAPMLDASLALTPARGLSVLLSYLSQCDTLLGMNLAFDLLYSRVCKPVLRPFLDRIPHIIDLSYVNFLESDVRPERSLKTIGTALALHLYDADDLEVIKCPRRLFWYNAQDTHNTVNNIATLAHRLTSEPSDALSQFCITHYTNTIRCCVDMTENGVPFSVPALTSLATTQLSTLNRCASTCPIPLSGEGSQKAQQSYMQSLYDEAVVSQGLAEYTRTYDPLEPDLVPPNEVSPSTLIAVGLSKLSRDPLIQYTEKTRVLCYSESNRSHLLSLIPPSSHLHASFSATNATIDEWSKASKLFGTYLFPLLWRQRRKPYKQTSRLVPLPVPNPLPLPPCPEEIPCLKIKVPKTPRPAKSPSRTTRKARAKTPSPSPSPATVPSSSDSNSKSPPASSPPSDPTTSSPSSVQSPF